jgi:NADH dehydrogenase
MILVTGGTGLVGSAVVQELASRAKPVAVMSRDAASVKQRFPDLSVEAREGDVTQPDSLTEAFADIEAVVNCVQFPNSPIENPRKGWTFEQVDHQGTVNQVVAAEQAGVARFIYVRGVGAAQDASQHWFVSKWKAEEAVRASGLSHVIIQPTWVYGPEDVALNRFMGFARRLPFVPTFGNGEQMMQPIFVDDIAKIIADAVDKPEATDQTFEAGGPDRLTMDDVVRTALEVAGKKRPILHQPAAIGKAMATLLQVLPGPPLTPDSIDFITNEAVADNAALERVFSPKLTPLREALATYLA